LLCGLHRAGGGTGPSWVLTLKHSRCIVFTTGRFSPKRQTTNRDQTTWQMSSARILCNCG